MPKKQTSRKYNYQDRHCDKCGEHHYRGELTYHGFIPGKGHYFTCRKCDEVKVAIEKAVKIKEERQKLRDSQPKLF
jgi:hypothetical protein